MLRVMIICAGLVSCVNAYAAEIIGLSLPLTGRFAPVAERMEFGALMAARQLKAQGRSVTLKVADDACDPEKAAGISRQFRDDRVEIVIGLPCFATGRAVAQQLSQQGEPPVPVIMTDTRNPLLQYLREVDKLPIFSLSASPDAEAEAVVDKILPRFGSRPFAIIDDGSVYGRGLAEAVRERAEEAGRQAVTTANFRPLQTTQIALLRRLQQAGAEALFLAANPEDVVTILRDMRSLGYNWPVGTGEPSRLLPFTQGASSLPEGLLMVRGRDPDTSSAAALLKQLRDDKVEVEDSVLIGYALVELAAAVQGDTPNLIGPSFQTVIGRITFGNDGRANPAPFQLYRWDGGRFSPANGG